MKEYIVRYETEQIENSEFFYGGKVECELIRCKDCKYYTGYECIRAKVSNIRVITDENEYCSRAERKDE